MQLFLLFLTFLCLQDVLRANPLEECPAFPSESAKAKKYLERLTSEQMDVNWNLNDFFGSIVIINLPESTERLASIKERLKEINCEQFDVFKGIDGRKVLPEMIWRKFNLNWAKIDLSTEEGRERFDSQRKGEAGCYLSHYLAIKVVKENFDKALKAYQEAVAEKNEEAKKIAYQDLLKYRSVMILEDDTGFGIRNEDRISTSLKNAGKAFYEAMGELPADWDMFYFMTYCRQSVPNEVYKPHLIKVNSGFSAIAYVVNYSMYDRILQELGTILNPNKHFVLPVDSVYSMMHHICRCYAVTPSVAYQKIGISTINTSFTPEVIQFQPLPPL